MRLQFPISSTPVLVSLTLMGLTVHLNVLEGPTTAAYTQLTAAGVQMVEDAAADYSFPVTYLPNLLHAKSVKVDLDSSLEPVWEILMSPPIDGLPVTVHQTVSGRLQLTWMDSFGVQHEEVAEAGIAKVLMVCEIPFSASASAWDSLAGTGVLPILAGRAKVNLDRFIEIHSSVPQVAEAAPLRGVFRLDETHLGMPLCFASDITAAPGFVWEGAPKLQRTPWTISAEDLPLEVDPSHLDDLREFVGNLDEVGAQVIVAASGLGRRLFALAALHVQGNLPALIVCSPARVWAWARHCQLMGLTWSLTAGHTDVRIVTFHDVVGRVRLPHSQAVILDGLDEPEGALIQVRDAIAAMDWWADDVRIAVCSTWPERIEDQIAIMSVLRPAEFTGNTSIQLRYPGDSAARAQEHVNAYVFRRSPSGDRTPFHRSQVRTVTAPATLISAFEDEVGRAHIRKPEEQVALLWELSDVGSASTLSPKLAGAAQQARETIANGGKVAILFRHPKAQTVLRTLLRPAKSILVDATVSDTDLTALSLRLSTPGAVLIRYDRTIPNLRDFDEVVVVSYPSTFATLEQAVGGSDDESGVPMVTCMHMPGLIDDRVAMLAALRWSSASVRADEPLSDGDLSYLLRSRWSVT